MTQDTNQPDTNDERPEQEQPHADASIDLRMEGPELQINIVGPEDHLSNEAVHFAHWLGRNLTALVFMARADMDNQTRILDQARAIAQLTKPEEGRPVIELPVRALRGPSGERLQ
jgi:hypothetical protein